MFRKKKGRVGAKVKTASTKNETLYANAIGQHKSEGKQNFPLKGRASLTLKIK